MLATGGDDQKVNLWKLGSSACLLVRRTARARPCPAGRDSRSQSLSGHRSGVTSVCFDAGEETIVAGSAGGSIKVFDLSAAQGARARAPRARARSLTRRDRPAMQPRARCAGIALRA